MTPVTSSAVSALGYEPASKTLHVQFSNGRLHEFPNIEPDEYQRFLHADSIGRHFNQHFRGRDHVRLA